MDAPVIVSEYDRVVTIRPRSHFWFMSQTVPRRRPVQRYRTASSRRWRSAAAGKTRACLVLVLGGIGLSFGVVETGQTRCAASLRAQCRLPREVLDGPRVHIQVWRGAAAAAILRRQ